MFISCKRKGSIGDTVTWYNAIINSDQIAYIESYTDATVVHLIGNYSSIIVDKTIEEFNKILTKKEVLNG